MGSLRTEEMAKKYMEYKKDGHMSRVCNLCEKAPLIKEFNYWKIVENIFPWDNVAKLQHMIVPKRHVIYDKLNDDEKKEFDEIKVSHIEKEYELIAEVTNKKKSIPEHFHIHLIIMKD
jgi:hypothetical protein